MNHTQTNIHYSKHFFSTSCHRSADANPSSHWMRCTGNPNILLLEGRKEENPQGEHADFKQKGNSQADGFEPRSS